MSNRQPDDRDRDEILTDYDRYALQKLRDIRNRAARELQQMHAARARPEDLWRAEGRLASWNRALEAVEAEFRRQ